MPKQQSKNSQALVGIFLIVLILVGDLVTGAVSSHAPSAGCASPCLILMQGPTLASVTVASGIFGSTAVIFSPAYTANPSLMLIPQSFTASGVPSSTTIYSTLGFQSGVTETWTGMPAVDTEIYGDALGQHRVVVDWVGASSFRFGYNCPTNSNTAGAYLTIEYSVDGGATFTELSSSQRAIIDGTVCPNGAGFGSAIYTAIPALAQTTSTILLINGHGGGGVGDNPQFSELWVEWSTVVLGPSNNIFQWRACQTSLTCLTQPAASKTGFTIFVNLAYPVASSTTFKFTWSAGLPA